MPPRLRRAILLREWQGLSYAEIAQALDISHSAVETLIFRARKHLAKALDNAVARPARRVVGVLNLPSLLTALRGMLANAGAAKLAAGAVVFTVAASGGVAAELAVSAAPAKSRGAGPQQSSHRPLPRFTTGAARTPSVLRVQPAGLRVGRSRDAAESVRTGSGAATSPPPTGSAPEAPAPLPPTSGPAASPPGGSQGDPVVDPTLPAVPTGGVPDPVLPVSPSVPIPTDAAPTVATPTLPIPTPTVPEPTLPAPPTLP